MGEAKRRKALDPSYGKVPQFYSRIRPILLKEILLIADVGRMAIHALKCGEVLLHMGAGKKGLWGIKSTQDEIWGDSARLFFERNRSPDTLLVAYRETPEHVCLLFAYNHSEIIPEVKEVL